MFKKLFSLTLVLCCTLSLVSFNAYASEIEDTEEIEELEIQFVYNEDTGDYDSVIPFASEYFNVGKVNATVSGSKITFSYSIDCYGADYFTLRIEHHRSKNGTSGWSAYDYKDETVNSTLKVGSFTSDYSSSYYHRGYITAKAYVNDKVVETRYYYSEVK